MPNRVCQILGIEYPVVQAPMFWLTDAALVAAVSNAGGLGSLGPNAGQTTVTRDPIETAERMRVEIKKVKALTVPFYQGENKEARIVTNAPFVNQHIIFPFGWETRYPKAYKAVTEFLRKFDANEHDDIEDCLTGIYEKEIATGNTKPYNAISRGIRVH